MKKSIIILIIVISFFACEKSSQMIEQDNMDVGFEFLILKMKIY